MTLSHFLPEGTNVCKQVIGFLLSQVGVSQEMRREKLLLGSTTGLLKEPGVAEAEPAFTAGCTFDEELKV